METDVRRQPTVSVIVPTYQHAREIGSCLDSIFAQDFQDFETIVVNDGSTDDTLEVLRPYEPRITLINHLQNLGGNTARNNGFDRSRGRFVIFCDADVIMRPQMLSRLLAALEEHPAAVYAYASFRYGWKKFSAGPFDADRLRRENYIMTTSLIRREKFPRFDQSLFRLQDWDLWLTMLEQGSEGVWVPEVLFKVIPHRGGISAWLPRVFFRIPWERFGFAPGRVRRYREAEAKIKEKHNLP